MYELKSLLKCKPICSNDTYSSIQYRIHFLLEKEGHKLFYLEDSGIQLLILDCSVVDY